MYLIPNEIKSKPKLLGLEVKEITIVLVSFLLILTILSDMVHSLFVIPFYLVSAGLILWLMMPSLNNRQKKNYQSLFLFFKRKKVTYHAIDGNPEINAELYDIIEEERKECLASEPATGTE